MEQQNLRTSILSQLQSKATDSSIHRKALILYESIIESSREIPNFDTNYANTDANFALFVFGSVFKLLTKLNESNGFNLDAMLLLINQTLPSINASTLKMGQNSLLSQLQARIYQIIKSRAEEKTPLMLRLAVSILSHTLINTDNIENNVDAKTILCEMFEYAVESHRTNILSKEASKMMTHLIKDNPNLSKILSRHASNTMLSTLDTSSWLYLNNVRDVIAEFPYQQINDIGYRLCKHLNRIECENENDELYLAQTYFFIEKLVNKFSGSTLEEICKEFVNNVPSSAQSESKVIFCYMQALHGAFEALVSMNEKVANKYISVIVSILQEFMVKGGKIEKQAIGIMKSIMSNCIRKSLWAATPNQQDFLNFDDVGINEKGNNFTKVVCMLQAMLADQFKNTKATAAIIEAFFASLDESALEGTQHLISKVVEFRDSFDEKSYRNAIHAIFGAMGIRKMCEMYPIQMQGDISSENFESLNNLWMLYCTEKYEGTEDFNTFVLFYYPILIELNGIIANPNVAGARKDGYKALKEMFWRCLKVFCKNPDPNTNFLPLIESIRFQLNSASDSTMEHIAMALENLCSSLYQNEYECSWANNLISLLAKLLVLEKNNSKQILRAIKYLSVICEKDYLNRVFDKNMVKLLQEKEQGTLAHAEHIGANLKNLEILIAVSSGINFYDPTVINPYRVSREELVVKLIAELIAETNFFQKKAYKYIIESLPLMGQGYLIEVVDLLEAHHHKITIASKHYRLAILMYLWNQLNKNDDNLNDIFEFIKKYLPEILFDMRQSNQRARKQANVLFESFCKKLEEMGLIQGFIEIMCAGLATDSVEMKVATIHGITAIYTKKISLELEFSLGILEIVLMLLYEKKHEIYKAIVEFSRRFVFSVDTSKTSHHILTTIIEQLFKSDVQSKMEHRSILKHFLLKLSKKFGRTVIEKMIPADDRKVLSNAIKIENRERRKKREKQQQRRMQAQEAKKKQQQNSEQSDDEDEEQGYGEGMDEEGGEQLKELDNTDNLLLKYDLEKENFHFEEEKLNIKANLKKEKQERKGEDDVTFGENGIMIVRDDPRRPRNIKEEETGENEQVQAREYLNVKKKRKLNDVHEVKESGSTFKSNRAGGDVQQKDKPEPYAFIQFNSKALNKRFKKRAETVFDKIFQRKEGGLKGIKSKLSVKAH